jgi:hypothetical protein
MRSMGPARNGRAWATILANAARERRTRATGRAGRPSWPGPGRKRNGGETEGLAASDRGERVGVPGCPSADDARGELASTTATCCGITARSRSVLAPHIDPSGEARIIAALVQAAGHGPRRVANALRGFLISCSRTLAARSRPDPPRGNRRRHRQSMTGLTLDEDRHERSRRPGRGALCAVPTRAAGDDAPQPLLVVRAIARGCELREVSATPHAQLPRVRAGRARRGRT